MALQQIQNSIKSMDDVEKEKNLREEIEVLLDREELMWAQKARTKWILQGIGILDFFKLWSNKEGLEVEYYKLRMIKAFLLTYQKRLKTSSLLISRKNYENCCEILKYSQVYKPYRSIVGQERGRTHRDLYECRKIN